MEQSTAIIIVTVVGMVGAVVVAFVGNAILARWNNSVNKEQTDADN